MERKRNRPEKYNRDLVHKTVKAVEKVSAVRPACASLCQLLAASYLLGLSSRQMQQSSPPSRQQRSACLWRHA